MQYYDGLLKELNSYADESYRSFHKRLLKNDSVNVLGVRVPQLRKIAKSRLKSLDELLSCPDEYYEVTFIKLTAVSLLSYGEFIKHVDGCVALIDNWATCDCFTPKCIAKYRSEFLPYILTYIETDKEFYQRFALTTLLHFYVEEKYFDTIIHTVKKADTQKYYYVHMAVAWLVAEAIIKMYDDAVDFLNQGVLDKKTHNKAIQKALESYRLTDEQKTYLKGLKR
ncbi:MAG: DNA alkylation repair protein [Clostridia bacterium]|nr:DNA alkylation repair protein [Clostridia bacterium]